MTRADDLMHLSVIFAMALSLGIASAWLNMKVKDITHPLNKILRIWSWALMVTGFTYAFFTFVATWRLT